ncbi:hypothetical protein GWK47_051712 [Chionoecetes opilio]|uniref:Uncharacterized protein n=1 Tax=Chionoecetes opilio TaxID=41210 RepID=A0A8J4Y9M2_CHIOP|nr:hypothetical protein GWK47_051712 [Chionoecetes opilio]
MGLLQNSLLLWTMTFGTLGGAAGVVVRCPKPGSSAPSNCTCSNTSLSIRCNFQNKWDAVLTKELFEPYLNMSLNTAYVRVTNATSVNVTSGFMQRWLSWPSSAFDVWNSGTVTLQPTPRLDNDTRLKPGSFAGVGIMNCHIPEIPNSFMRDRARGALRIKLSKVGVMRTGFFNNVGEIRYIALEDTVVDEVEGSVAAEGYITLSRRNVHSWTGLELSNVSIGVLGPGAFNLTHKSDMEVMSVKNCSLGWVGTGALAASGDIEVTFENNTFKYLQKGAFKVAVTGSVSFTGNQMGAKGLDALGDLECHNASSFQNNTILVSTFVSPVPGQASSTPFHPSCGKAQLFLVLTPARELLMVEDARAAWVLGATVLVLGMAMVVGVVWSFRRHRPIFSINCFPTLLQGRNYKSSQENLPKNIELNTPSDDLEEGTSVSDLDMACESQQDIEQPLLGAAQGVQGVESCSAASFPASEDEPDATAIFFDEDLI